MGNVVNPLTEAQKAEAERLYVDCLWSVDRIGLHFGKSGAGIHHMLKARGVKFRTAWKGIRPLEITDENRRSGARKAKIAVASQSYRQESIITFLPESPALQAAWESELARIAHEKSVKQDAMAHHH